MKSYKIMLALLPILSFGNHAFGAVSDGEVISAETMAPLASWVEEATHTTMEALPIATASGTKLKTALALHGVQQARAAAAYLPGRIYISNMIWDPESIRSQSYIVHELVHHAQLVSRREYPCHAAKEREAYMLQNQWLAEHNQPPIVSQEWIDNISSCSAPGADEDAD